MGMYAATGPYAGAPNYSAFLPYAADLSLFSQMVSAPGPLSRAALRRRDQGARAEGAVPWSNEACVPQLLSLCSGAWKPQLLSPTEARVP